MIPSDYDDGRPFALDDESFYERQREAAAHAEVCERIIEAEKAKRVPFLSLPLTPRIQQIFDALKAHYGAHHVCNRYYAKEDDADTQRYIYAERLQIGAQLGNPGCLAILTALSLETAHEPRRMA